MQQLEQAAIASKAVASLADSAAHSAFPFVSFSGSL